MATNYVLLTSQSSIQVLSPTVTQDVIVATIQTVPSGVIMDYWLPKDDFDAGTAPVILEAVAGGVEHIMASEPVSSAVGSTQLDSSGLLSEIVTFTVSYPLPNSPAGAATADVDVPVGDFGQDTIAGENFGLVAAEDLIQTAYAKLKALAAG